MFAFRGRARCPQLGVERLCRESSLLFFPKSPRPPNRRRGTDGCGCSTTPALHAMNVREIILDAVDGDSGLSSKVTSSLRQKLGRATSVVGVANVAGALEPILADAVEKRPSQLRKFGLKSAQLIAGLAADDRRMNERLAKLARDATVGIVFVDVVDFMTITAEKGDETATRLLAELEDVIERKIRGVKGECVKRLGDGFLLAFPSASQAVRGAAAVEGGVRRRGDMDSEFDLQVRIAVHAGEPLIDQADLVGFDVNLAARLLEHCRPGEVVVSESAKELSERRLRRLTFDNERVVKIKGLSAKVPIYSVATI